MTSSQIPSSVGGHGGATPTHTIVVGTQSKLKLTAVTKAFSCVSLKEDALKFTVQGCDITSAVSSQPYGVGETLHGARHRALEAKRLFPKAKIWIGIESGLVSINHWRRLTLPTGTPDLVGEAAGRWFDVASIIVLEGEEKDGTEFRLWSDIFEVPPRLVKECLNDKGEVSRNWSNREDPHKKLTDGKTSRKTILSACLRAWIQSEGERFNMPNEEVLVVAQGTGTAVSPTTTTTPSKAKSTN